jgi:hypothetical protein
MRFLATLIAARVRGCSKSNHRKRSDKIGGVRCNTVDEAAQLCHVGEYGATKRYQSRRALISNSRRLRISDAGADAWQVCSTKRWSDAARVFGPLDD